MADTAIATANQERDVELARLRAITEAENARLAAQPPVTGAQYAAGARPVQDGTLIVEPVEEACPLPGR